MSILDKLSKGVVIGDGGFVFSLEKRGYVKAGPWTPEATIESPEAVLQLHREFLRAGSDVMQTFTFYASDDKLKNRGNTASSKFGSDAINEAACKIARQVADEDRGIVAGGVSQTPTYLSTQNKEKVQKEFKKQCKVFEGKVDFMLAEYFEHVEEMEWAIEVLKEMGVPVAANMCIGIEGDLHGVSTGECAVRMANVGADIVGINCHFGPFESLKAMELMKQALDEQDLHPFLMLQPLAFHTPDAKKQGFIDLPEFPFALEPRVCTRWEIQQWARKAYDMGIRYLGGCCGFEPYHIRAISEELKDVRAINRDVSIKHIPWGGGLLMHTKPWVRERAKKEYWEKIVPSTGRPDSVAFSKPDEWKVTAGDAELLQEL